MSCPRPAALLVDHPVLARPLATGDALEVILPAPEASRRSLNGSDRLALAVQVTALCVLLGEFDLWPGSRSLRRLKVVRGAGGPQAVVPGFPMSLSTVFRRIGGGERAVDALQAVVLEVLRERLGIDTDALLAGEHQDLGFFLEPILNRLLAKLSAPLDVLTARSLWAVRLDLPSLPEEGEVEFWSVPLPHVAARLGAAVWAATRRSGETCWYRHLPDHEAATAPLPRPGLRGTLVVSGEPDEGELAAVERWTRRPGCRAVVVGRFPSGWSPPRPPGLVGRHLERHLALTGTAPDRSRLLVRLRRGRFDPLAAADRRALTQAARHLYADPPGGTGGAAPAAGAVDRVLGACPDGVPEGFLVLHSGLPPDTVRRLAAEEGVHDEAGRWRRAVPAALRRDPLHAEVAALYPDGDPRRLRHHSLATGVTDELLRWAADALAELRHAEVRSVLEPVATGELGNDVQLALAEACLADLDLAAAERALEALPAAQARPWRRWLEAMDPAPTARPALPGEKDLRRAPRAVAEAAVGLLRSDREWSPERRRELLELLGRATAALDGPVRSSFLIERATLEQSPCLADRRWRQQVVGGHVHLRRLYLHRRADGLAQDGRVRAAYGLTLRVAQGRWTPGRRAMAELDAARLAAELSLKDEVAAHHRRAFRLLRVAGFRHLTGKVLLRLAELDLDLLGVARAEARLAVLDAGRDGPAVTLQLARAALVRGSWQRLEELLRELDSWPDGLSPGEAEQARLLRGVERLLQGATDDARRMLEGLDGVMAAAPWLALARVASGGAPPVTGSDDPWGVWRAAHLVHDARTGATGVSLPDGGGGDEPRLTDALALAVAVRVAGGLGREGAASARPCAVRLRREGLAGWAQELEAQEEENGDGLLETLAGLVDRGHPAALDDGTWRSLLHATGLSGLEVRAVDDGRVLWQVGQGTPHAAERRGHLELVPLGAVPRRGPTWSLLTGLLELLTPRAPRSDATDPEAAATGIHGRSAAVVSLRRHIRRYAGTTMTVVLLGETGTGKELVARALHTLSGRPGPFVAVNIAAVPSALLEAELFGVEKGAFTGADRSRRGLVDTADGGTLFIDEIGDLELPLQVKLLRFLESREVRPVGGRSDHRVDVRVVAATHRDLERRRRDGRFRADLYYRIAAARIQVPPLRHRREDIRLLVDLFEQDARRTDGLAVPRWSREAEELLLRHSWPGNVRELRNVVEGAMVHAAGSVVTPEMLPIAQTRPAPSGTWEEATREFRRNLLEAALDRAEGNRSAAARELGISRQTLLYHMKALGVGKPPR